jgi:hypothetical protein
MPKTAPIPPSPSPSLDPSKHTSIDPTLATLPAVEDVRAEFSAPAALPGETLLRHSGWLAARRRIFEALTRTRASAANRDRFRECGSRLVIEWNPAKGEARLSCNKCRSRWCRACGADRSAILAANLSTIIETKNTLFVTLTRRHSHAALTDQIDDLYEAFGKLRRRQWWRANVTGGAAFMEVKLGEADGLWHVHLHLIVESKYLDQKALSREWLAVTMDSSIVDVRKMQDHGQVARYVCKYVTKPCTSEIVNQPHRLDEFIVAMKGRRLCLTWGTWRGLPLNEVDDPEPGWISLGTARHFFDRCAMGEADALQAAEQLVGRYGVLIEAACRWTHGPPPDWLTRMLRDRTSS